MSLSPKFKVDAIKTPFSYLFSKENNLSYRGTTPDIYYYKNMDVFSYQLIYEDNWSFKEESIKYLEKDLLGLYQILTKANKSFFIDYGIDITDSLTISSLAMKVFHKKYYNNIPSISNTKVYRDIKSGCYGGITEVYRPYGEIIYYYDVNSLYPYVALNPIPGIHCTRVEYINHNVSIHDIFGFYLCEIECDNNYLGLLPFRDKRGLIFHMGKWKGWYFSEELKFAHDNGYKIKVLKGYSFNKELDVF